MHSQSNVNKAGTFGNSSSQQQQQQNISYQWFSQYQQNLVSGLLEPLERISVRSSKEIKELSGKPEVKQLLSNAHAYSSQLKQQASQRMQFPPQMMDQLNVLVQRLETAVQRIETATAQDAQSAAGYARSVASNAVGAVAGAAQSAMGAVQHVLHPQQATSSPTEDDLSSSPVVREYDDAVASGPLRRYLDLSKQLGGDIAQHAQMVERAFSLQRDMIGKSSKYKKPSSDQALSQLIQPLSEELQKISQFREKNRTSPNFNHLSAISESISALGWITVSPAPAPYIEETGVNATQFYTNRILKDFRGKDERHVEWTKAWVETLKQLQQYVKKQHTTGLAWNARGADLGAGVRIGGGGAAAAAGGGGGGPPMPPPPPPPSFYDDRKDNNSTSSGGGGVGGGAESRAALFNQINVGSNITSSLKKVSADQQTHKNPNLRQQGPVPAKSTTTTSNNTTSVKTTGSRGAFEPSGPPKIELDGKKWRVENHSNNQNIIISDTQMNQSVYIYRCNESLVQIKGKLNSVIMDGCRKTSVVLDSLVSALELVNCQSVKAQINGKLPTVSIEKTDGAQIFLSKESSECEIVTAKSSEMNICIPKDNGEYSEYAVPEQFKTVFDKRKGTLKTTANEQLG